MRIALTVFAALVPAFVVTSWWALESGGVAFIETRTGDGSVRRTHVRYIEPDVELWLEAGTPENAWFRDIQREPKLRFVAGGRSATYAAHPDPSASARVRSLLRQKYGLRDRWVGLLVHTSRSVTVRMTDPAEPEAD